MILLNPGPVNVSERVRAALAGPDLCHREAEFYDLQDEVRAGLLQVYDLDPDSWTAVTLGGSGTAAMEAMVTSLVPRSGRLLVLENGIYGERMTAIAAGHGIRCAPLGFEWGQEIDLERVRHTLASTPGITHLAVVHHETTTGRLNALGPLASLCGEHGVDLLIDAVSSFGAEAIAFDDARVAACAGTANKCLHGLPGVSFVVARRRALATGCDPPRGAYLDLVRYAREQERRGTPFTPPIPALYALREALAEHAEAGGWSARHERYGRLAEAVRSGLAGMGIPEHLPAESSSVVLRSYRVPSDRVSYDALHDALKERGFVIYAGQQRLSGEVFRISTMGEIGPSDVDRLLLAIGAILSTRNRSAVSP
jgi:2-aminoethylphosphonate-pyruvate transaminase